jgi:hypothetical protein
LTKSAATWTWRELLVELFDEDMRSQWGWRPPHSLDRLEERPVQRDSRVEIDVGGLKVPYFCGFITIDFAKRTVICDGVDQRTPADMRWEPQPEQEWWTRALACDWPQR